MADLASFEILQEKKLEKYRNFKDKVVQKAEWKFTDWRNSEFWNSQLHVFVKKCKYWFSNLKEVSNDKFLVISLYMEGLQLQVSPRQILLEFKKQFGIRGLKGFSVTRNSSFMVLYFDSVENRMFAAENFHYVDNFIVANSDWFLLGDTFDFKLLWLPPVVDIVTVNEKLSEYAEVVEIQNETCDLHDEDILPSGKFYGRIKLTHTSKLVDIPHIMGFDDYEGLLVIPKRKALCLNCRELGHISNKCPKPYCPNCQDRLPRGHKCIDEDYFPSYANVVSLNPALGTYSRNTRGSPSSVVQSSSEVTERPTDVVVGSQWGDDPGGNCLSPVCGEGRNQHVPGSADGIEFMDVSHVVSKRSFDQVLSQDGVALSLVANIDGAQDTPRRQSSRVKAKVKDGNVVVSKNP